MLDVEGGDAHVAERAGAGGHVAASREHVLHHAGDRLVFAESAWQRTLGTHLEQLAAYLAFHFTALVHADGMAQPGDGLGDAVPARRGVLLEDQPLEAGGGPLVGPGTSRTERDVDPLLIGGERLAQPADGHRGDALGAPGRRVAALLALGVGGHGTVNLDAVPVRDHDAAVEALRPRAVQGLGQQRLAVGEGV